jgi:hypothetical protein
MQRVAQQRAALEKARQQAEKDGQPMPAAPSSMQLPDEPDDDDDDEDGEDGEDSDSN